MSLTARDLNAALWAAADEMRLVMSADVYKDYLLGLVFYKALSDKILVEAYELLNDEKPESLEVAQKAYEEAGADSEVWFDLKAELEDRFGCAIHPRMTFSAFYQQINERTFIRCHTTFRHPFNFSWSGKTCDIRRSSKTTS